MSHWSDKLGTLPLLADGPVEAWLRLRGFVPGASGAGIGDGPAPPTTGAPLLALNLERPDAVAAAHRAYLKAGALLHRTHTAGANALDLAPRGLASRCEAINNSGAAALRQAIGLDAILAGSIGPVLAPGHVERARAAAYGEQAIYLSDTGADLLILEGFGRADEAVLALRAIGDTQGAAALALLRYGERGRTADGLSPGAAGRLLLDAGAEALGVNCELGDGPGGGALDRILDELQPLTVPLAVFPSVQAIPGEATLGARGGNPEAEAERFAGTLARLASRGVTIVGGGEGTLPAHIRAAAQRLGRV